MVCCHMCDIYASLPGTGPDGRIIKKDIDSFVPTKAAPVSYIWLFFFWHFVPAKCFVQPVRPFHTLFMNEIA